MRLAISKVGLLAPPRGGTLRARLRRALGRWWLAALLVAVCFLYTFIGSAGLPNWPVYGVYHDLQADGFLKGQLSLPIEPAPQLLHAKNPYDRANMQYWWLDASFYHGKYYMYWGPVPALFEAAAKALLRIHHTVGDQYLCVFFYCLTFFCGALLVDRMVARLFSSKARAFVALGVLVFACANPSPHGVATAATYYTAIIAAQAWLCAGLVLAFDAVWEAGTDQARRSRLLLAGACWALALGSRVSMLPAIALLVPLTAAFEALPQRRRAPRFVVNALALGVPLAAAGAGLLLFNKLRFDDWLEFGSKIQLSGFPTIRFSPTYFLANLYSYSLRPWSATCEFPYLNQVWNQGRSAFPRGFPLPGDYDIIEPVVGWVRALPISWLLPFAFVLAPWKDAARSRQARNYLFCLVAFSILASVSGMITLFVYGATMRYLNDISSGLVLLSLLGAFALRFHRFGRVAPRAISSVIGVLGLATVGIGLLLGYQGYNFHFHTYNPTLDRKLVRTLSICGSR